MLSEHRKGTPKKALEGGLRILWFAEGLWEKAMATHSNTLTWQIAWTEEPGRLQSMGSLRSRT